MGCGWWMKLFSGCIQHTQPIVFGRGEYKNREMRNREMPVKKRAIQKYGFSLVTVRENMLSKLLSVC
jgi:hypothetical protein